MNICHMYKLMIKTRLYFAYSSLYMFGGDEIWVVLDALIYRSLLGDIILVAVKTDLFQKLCV